MIFLKTKFEYENAVCIEVLPEYFMGLCLTNYAITVSVCDPMWTVMSYR